MDILFFVGFSTLGLTLSEKEYRLQRLHPIHNALFKAMLIREWENLFYQIKPIQCI